MSFNFMTAITVHSDFGTQENKICHCFHFFPVHLPWKDGNTYHDFHFFECWVLSQLFLLSSFTFIKRLFSFSSLSAIRVVSSAYLRLLFLLAILIPAYDSSSPAFHMMYSASKLTKPGDSIQSCCTPFPIWNQSVVPCPVLTVASYLHKLSQETSKVVWYCHPFKNFP